MNILIIGGAVFLGRALVTAAVQRGHTVTLFNRGRSAPEALPDIEQLHGDRDGDLSVLDGRTWDAVIDTCGYVPRIVRHSATHLAPHTANYTFISSISVYADISRTGLTEADTAELGRLEDETIEEVTGESYGPLKLLCEEAATAAVGADKTLIIRPGLIVGSYDRSDRFTYWPVRVAAGGRVLAPGRPERLVQFVDVRDLAEFTILALEQKLTGVYNVDGIPLPMREVLEECRVASGAEAEFVWVPDDQLVAQEVGAWMEMPLWIPESDDAAGFFAFDCTKARQAGLGQRPLADTITATLAWAQSRPADYTWRAGLAREKEEQVLG
ncbi:MAG: NAD-dependent epimerase/dehydratase family protein [Chloroflexi bacterium]|nr:NAD-dependent epimerase/dehydratase family protein [Chloroflexota bacterium]